MGARILVIEDNPANLDLMMYLLAAFGHTPLSATEGSEGLAAAAALLPDLIICDVQLPTMDGYEVARQLKADAALRSIPLIAVTAFAMPGDRDKAIAAGFDGYIAKPIAPDQFIQNLDHFLPVNKRSTPREFAPTRSSPPVVASRRGTILVVDDSKINCDLIRSTLEPMGYTLVVANSIESALSAGGSQAVDMVLSDLHMPDGNGDELIRVIKSDPKMKGTPVVIISSTSSGHIDARNIAALGAAGLILRPIEPEELLNQVEACLAQRVEI
ncbi:MAG: response regulator [Phycisphaerales bacterium]|nr:response regulator [Phycisphaerales bacterium]MCI0674723.1 response regulator [Phycisphaerales bacterium]